jgi:SOS response regulatory protein OraA/RecX
VPTVTALRERRDGRVVIDVDGTTWRVVPSDVVVRTGVRVGVVLERPLLRELGRALRRADALEIATRALRAHDRSHRELEARLEDRGVSASTRAEALHVLAQSGLVDDGRVAANRAASLADRGYGDAAIAADLERRGIPVETVAAALETLQPEPDRAAEIVARRGNGLKTARYLAGKGFAEESIDLAGGADFAPDP